MRDIALRNVLNRENGPPLIYNTSCGPVAIYIVSAKDGYTFEQISSICVKCSSQGLPLPLAFGVTESSMQTCLDQCFRDHLPKNVD